MRQRVRHSDTNGTIAYTDACAWSPFPVPIRAWKLKSFKSLGVLGYRCRPEPWNRTEMSSRVACRKLVFAPPSGARLCNVHIREDGTPNARYALLFRDYLRADDSARQAWGAFKKRLAVSVPDLADYGQIKAPRPTFSCEPLSNGPNEPAGRRPDSPPWIRTTIELKSHFTPVSARRGQLP
jgi:hypothetical protein